MDYKIKVIINMINVLDAMTIFVLFSLHKLTSIRWIFKNGSVTITLLAIGFGVSRSTCTICPLEIRDTDDGSAWKAGTDTLNAFACGEITIGLVLIPVFGCASCD